MMSNQEDKSSQVAQTGTSSLESETKSRQTLRSSKDKKKRKTRSRVIKDEEESASNDPDYSPNQEMLEDGSGGVSTCSTPVDEKLSSVGSTPVPVVYPNSGTICALCYCGEKSLLGQGDLTRYDPTPGFNPFRKPTLRRGRDSFSGLLPASDTDRSSKSPSRSRNRETRNSRESSSRHAETTPVSVVYELSLLGCQDIADPTNVFEPSGHVTAHHCCAAWSEGVTQNELYQLLQVDKAVHQGMASKCSYCNRYGATIKCKASKCDRLYHYPCAAGCGCFQDIKSMLMLCPNHLEQAPSIGAPEELNCAVCDDMGEISDFLFCTSCGHHYHGNCLQPFVEVNPVVRAGWQCPDCKICQTCRQPGDDNKMLVCDSCDKGYHTYCLEPAIPCIPTNGWCCQNCRRCVDCGAKRESGAPSIWNFSEEICDNCFQHRDNGHCCPVCAKGYSEKIQHGDMMQCNGCKKWVHDDCDDTVDLDAYYDMGADYTCPKCRDEAVDITTPPPTEDVPVSGKAMEEDLETESNSRVEEEEKPAKRSSISSSVDSNKSTSGMKGSSTDPMLFAPQASSSHVTGDKQRHISDESMTIVGQPLRTVVERKVSGDAQLAPLFNEQDALSLFSNDAFQPIVNVPMLPPGDDALGQKGVVEEWTKGKAQKPTVGAKTPSENQTRPGAGKPGSIFGKGKPYGNKKKSSAARSSKGKTGNKDKSSNQHSTSRGHRRQRHGGSLPIPSSANISSPVATAGGGVGGGNGGGQVHPPGSTGMNMRRRSRARWSRQDSTLGGVDMSPETADEEFGDSMHNTVVLCSAEDAFTLNQDMCVVCGSFGQGPEGRLVACSQCGQCYHPYCVNLRLTKVVLRKGWRCLDCTVCEECGAADDPSHLLLCDDCDISYHTYCLKPPLQHVPKGGWKCKWCVRCTHCGSNSPGFNCDWMENYTSCGPCSSLSHCPVCRRSYRDEETIMQCSSCERWLHASCEYLYTESDVEKVLEKGYSCVFCRPKGSIPPHLDLNPPNAFEGDPSSGIYLGRTRSDVEQVKEYHKDGVALTSAGLQHIQQLMQNAMGLNKKKPNVQKRKSQSQKQAEKLSSPSDVKTAPDSGTISTPTDPDGKEGNKDNELLLPVLDLSRGSHTDADTGLEMSISSDGGQLDTPEGIASPLDGAEIAIGSTDLTKQTLSGIQDPAIKRRRKPYRPGIGGFMVRQRNRGGFATTKGRRNRIFKTVASLPTANISNATGFNNSPSKEDEVKMRASEITGENESSYIQHEREGGITIAHQDSVESKEEASLEPKCEAQTSKLVSPLKLKISTLSQPAAKPKRKKRSRLIDQFPLYIQEGFFGPSVLTHARSVSLKAIDLFEEQGATNKPSLSNSSQIVLPERVKLRLDTQVAMKAAESVRKAEMKQNKQARNLPASDDDPLSEVLLGDLPDDLPFKADDILGMLSGTQGGGNGNDSHENILSPSALETLVTDGLASIGGDVTSLITDVLNNAPDGGDHNLLGDIESLTRPSKSSSSADLLEDALHVSSNSSSAFNIDPTDEIINQIVSQDMMPDTPNIKSERDGSMMSQKQTNNQVPSIHSQQHHHMTQQLSGQSQANYNIHSPMQGSMTMMDKHMFEGGHIASDSNFITPQQHPMFQASIQQPQMQAMQIDQQSCVPMQHQKQQKYIRHVQGGPGMSQSAPMNMPQQGHEALRHQAMMQRQHSVDAVQMDAQQGHQKVMTSSGPALFGAHTQAIQTPQTGGPQQKAVGQAAHPPGLVNKFANSPSISEQTGQVAVQNLPDLTRERTLFEPAATPWPLCTDLDGDTLSVNQRNILKWEKDEPLGQYATISPVLYANMKHSYLKKEYPDWPSRAKQIAKLWRKATSEERAPFLQKARDNRAYLKSSRRDLVEPYDQEEQDDEERANLQLASSLGATTGASGVTDSHPGSMGLMEGAMHQQLPQHSQMPGMKVAGSPSSDYNSFVKPRPLSRDPTPKPQSPGIAPPVGSRSYSPFSGSMSPGHQGPGQPRPQAYLAPRQWTDASVQGQASQQLSGMQSQQVWPGQPQGVIMQQQVQHGMRMPKMENMDASMMPSQIVRFPQPYQGNLPPSISMAGGVPASMNAAAKPFQRQDSIQDMVVNPNQEQFVVRPTTPRPGIPPQLLPQVVSPSPSMNQHSVPQSPSGSQAPGHGLRGASGSLPGTPQPTTPRDPFQELEKTFQRWPSTSSEQDALKLNTDSHSNTQIREHSVVSHSPVAGTPRTPSDDANVSLGSGSEGSEKLMSSPNTPGGRPQIREMLIRRTEQRRYKLLEQQTFPGSSWVTPSGSVVNRPPPPYPSQSPNATSPGAFAFNPGSRTDRFPAPQHQGVMQMGDPRMRGAKPTNLPSSPSYSAKLGGSHVQSPGSIPAFGVERVSGRTTTASSVSGAHPIQGQPSIGGGYIELLHSKHSDPAVRREQLFRSALPPASSSSQDIKPTVVPVSAGSSLSGTSTKNLLVPKSEPISDPPPLPPTSSRKSQVDKVQAETASADTQNPLKVSTSSAVVTTNITSSTSGDVIETSSVASIGKEQSTSNELADESSAVKVEEPPAGVSTSTADGNNLSVDRPSLSPPRPPSIEAAESEKSGGEAIVSHEHSYVRTSSEITQEDKDLKSSSSEAADKVKNINLSSATDGMVHGVGLTPPPDATVSLNATSPENGIVVSNVVIVEKDCEQESEVASVKKDEEKIDPLTEDKDKIDPLEQDQDKNDSLKQNEEQVSRSKDTEGKVDPSIDEEHVCISKPNDYKIDPSCGGIVEKNQTTTSDDSAVADTEKSVADDQTKKQETKQTNELASSNKPPVIDEDDLKEPTSNTIESTDLDKKSGAIETDEKLVCTDTKSTEVVTEAAHVEGTEQLETTISIAQVAVDQSAVEMSVRKDASALTQDQSEQQYVGDDSVAPSTAPSSELSSTAPPAMSCVESASSSQTAAPGVIVSTTSVPVATPAVVTSLPVPAALTSVATNVTSPEMTPSQLPTTVSMLTTQKQFHTTQPPLPSSASKHLPAHQRPKPLLIKEQPLLLQDLLDEEKEEQERAKLEKMNQELIQQPPALYSHAGDVGNREMVIMQAKVKVLSGISQVIKGSTSQAGVEGVPPPVPIVQRPVGSWQAQPTASHPAHVPDPALLSAPPAGGDSEQHKTSFEKWLYQHQALLQMQVTKLELTAKQHRSTKQALTKKQRQSKKSGEIFTPDDAQKLALAHKQLLEAQQQLDEARKEQVRHSELVQNYNAKQGAAQTFIKPPAAPPSQAIGEIVRMVQPQFQPQPSTIQTIARHQGPSGLPQGVAQPTKAQQVGKNTTVGFVMPTPSSSVVTQATMASHPATPSGMGEQQIQNEEPMFHQFQKSHSMRQPSQPEVVQYSVQPEALSALPSSLSQHTGVDPSKPINTSGQQLLGSVPQPQVVFPISINMRPTAPGHIQAPQVSSVNINTGGNMATKGPTIRQMVPGSPSPLATADGNNSVQIQQFIGDQMKSPIVEQDKPKRKSKKPKNTRSDPTPSMDPRYMMSPGMMHPGLPGISKPHFSPNPHHQASRVMTSPIMHTLPSSAVAMVTVVQSQHTGKDQMTIASQPMHAPQLSLTPSSGMASNVHATAPNSAPVFVTTQYGNFPPGTKLMNAPTDLLIAGQPISAESLKRNLPVKHTKAGAVPRRTPPLPVAAGLSDAELDIIMATDPDANSNPSTPDSRTGSSLSKSGPPSRSASPVKKELEPERKFQSLIDDTIDDVINDGLEYTQKVKIAKSTGGKVVPPQWMRAPKPTKFPPKPPTPQSSVKAMQGNYPGGFGQQMHNPPRNNQELLRLMLHSGNDMTGSTGSPTMGMVGAMRPYGGLGKSEFDMNSQMDGGQMVFTGDVAAKKKRSRGGSKDQDGKEKVKKKKKKKHHGPDEEAGFIQDPLRTSQPNAPKHAHKRYSSDHSPVKQPAPWKPLPLLPLVEPDIKINFSMCMPKGTGLADSKSLLEGRLGKATLWGIPDYYELLRCKDPLRYMHPPTPPSSLPPSPKRERIDSLDGDLISNHHVKIPDSLPTPPHQIPDVADDFCIRTSTDEAPPSSPELEDDKQPFSNDFLHVRTLSHKESGYQAHSPVLPVQLLPDKDEMEESDDVSVTISFKSGNSKMIKKSLSRLSRALGTSIVGFVLEDAKKKKEPLNESTNLLITRRNCYHCDAAVVGNGVRKPLFGEKQHEEDIIFCNKDCYFKNEFETKVKKEVPSTKKKWKASQIYQRHTKKIDISSLIAANPDPEYVSTRGRTIGATPTSGTEVVDDGSKGVDSKGRGRGRRRGSTGPGEEGKNGAKRWKGIKWKKWTVGVATSRTATGKPPADVDALLSKYGSALKPPPDIIDTRKCVLCGVCGDGVTKGVARLLNLDVDQWVHLNCALWSAEVYETQGGALINVDLAVGNGDSTSCVVCMKKGATIRCNRTRCISIYHCACALHAGCHFYKDKTVLCPSHTLTVGGQAATPPHHDQLKTLAVFRKVYVQRKETKQIASIMQQGELTQGEKNYILRVGALMFHAVGQLSTQQMAQFHSKSAIYPVGYKATRIYWSSNNTRKRTKYMCMITETDGKPWFTTRYQAVASRPKTSDKSVQGEWMEMSGDCVIGQWCGLLQQLASLRSQQKMLKLFPSYINGENVFGLTSPVVCRILESLPNIELCGNYKFRYGRSPILEVPLAINPTGSARSEPHIKHSRKKPHTLISNLISEYYESTGVGDASTSLYGKHFVHSKSSQYRRMKQEWRNNVNLGRSRIQGLGLFASRDIDPGTMVIEYIGQIIRSEVAEKREKRYEAANRGVYMFRLDSDYIVDATVTGGPARYINHSCNPNCVAEVVNFEKEKKIMIISNRLILSGEELNYDYKFDFEDDGNKIPCLCGATNCRKWMN